MKRPGLVLIVATLNGREDGSLKKEVYFRLYNDGEDIEEQTLGTSSPILTNIPSFFMRASKGEIMFC
jgi:hypothetical protein